MRNIRTLYGRLVPHTLSWSFCVKAEVKLAGLLIRVIPLVFGQLSSSLVKVTWGYAKNVRRILRSSGERGLATYLKACYLLLQHSAGGMKDNSPWALGANVSRTRRGIPRIINPQHRSLIAKGDVRITSFWLTLFGLYRVVEFKGALKLRTITEPGIDISKFREGWVQWIPDFYRRLRLTTQDDLKLNPSSVLDPRLIPFIRKASPVSGGFASVMGLPWEIALWGADPEMKRALLRWLNLVDGLELTWGLKAIWKFLYRRAYTCWCEEYAKPAMGPKEGWRSNPFYTSYRGSPLRWLVWSTRPQKNLEQVLTWYLQARWGKPLPFGRLGFKEEPGKIRVFAMVSLITQTLMSPLHEWIFSKLRRVSTDGTFDQVAPVERLIARMKTDHEFVASYDLSAATDRLPLQLQVDLLMPLLGAELSALWAFMLVGRPYMLPRIAKSYNLGFNYVSYAVGQPMGALSSWAMLALTHHALVQYAASNVYPEKPSWFKGYAVLGDDVVIADRAVAAQYLKIMKTIGVEISLAKSLVSNTSSLEFAKRTWISRREVTPISLAEMLVSLRNVGALEQLVLKTKKYGEIRISAVARFAGFGYRNLARLPVVLGLGNRLSGLVGYLSRPGGIWSMPVEAWLTTVAPGKTGELLDTRAWMVSGRLWKQVVSGLLRQMVGIDRLLYALSTYRMTDATFIPKRNKVPESEGATAERAKRTERKDFFGSSVKELFCLTEKSVEWNEFFTEWIMRPLSIRLRKTSERVDDILRVLDPNIQPNWTTLEEVWRQVFEAEDGVNSLPSSLEVCLRENEEVPTSTRLVTLWRALRRLSNREGISSLDLGSCFRREPKARRRRRGG